MTVRVEHDELYWEPARRRWWPWLLTLAVLVAVLAVILA